MHTDLPQIPTSPGDGHWARAYGDELGSIYRVDSEVPDDFCALAARIAARCGECDSIADEIDDIIIL